MQNDKMGWIVAGVALLFTASGTVKDYGSASQKIDALDKQVATIMQQQVTQGKIIATHDTLFLDIERRLTAIDRQMQSVAQIDTRLGRIEVIVEMIGKQVGAPVPQRLNP